MLWTHHQSSSYPHADANGRKLHWGDWNRGGYESQYNNNGGKALQYCSQLQQARQSPSCHRDSSCTGKTERVQLRAQGSCDCTTANVPASYCMLLPPRLLFAGRQFLSPVYMGIFCFLCTWLNASFCMQVTPQLLPLPRRPQTMAVMDAVVDVCSCVASCCSHSHVS